MNSVRFPELLRLTLQKTKSRQLVSVRDSFFMCVKFKNMLNTVIKLFSKGHHWRTDRQTHMLLKYRFFEVLKHSWTHRSPFSWANGSEHSSCTEKKSKLGWEFRLFPAQNNSPVTGHSACRGPPKTRQASVVTCTAMTYCVWWAVLSFLSCRHSLPSWFMFTYFEYCVMNGITMCSYYYHYHRHHKLLSY